MSHSDLLILVLLGILSFEQKRACRHGVADPEIGGFCIYCDTGMST